MDCIIWLSRREYNKEVFVNVVKSASVCAGHEDTNIRGKLYAEEQVARSVKEKGCSRSWYR